MSKLKAVCIALSLLAPAMAAAKPVVGPSMDRSVIEQTNAYRSSKGLGRVKVDRRLSAAAQWFADYYAANPGKREEWGHEYGGTTVLQRVEAQGFQGWCVAENLGWVGTSGRHADLGDAASRMLKGWKNSPGHNENLIRSRHDLIGVGSAEFRKDGILWVVSVQVFGCSPGSRAIPG